MNLNLYQNSDQQKIKKIFKNFLNLNKSFTDEFVMKFSNVIAHLSLELINRTTDDSIIFLISKIIIYIIKNQSGLKCILNYEFFLKIFNLTKNKKFVFSTEGYKILCVIIILNIYISFKYLVENEEINKVLISDFFVENQKEVIK